MYRVIIAGDRNWADLELEEKIRRLLLQMPKDPQGDWDVHGACSGVDQTAGRIARQLGFIVTEFPADWKKYGRAAGPIRNKDCLLYTSDAADEL